MYATDGRMDGQKQCLMPPSLRAGHNSNFISADTNYTHNTRVCTTHVYYKEFQRLPRRPTPCRQSWRQRVAKKVIDTEWTKVHGLNFENYKTMQQGTRNFWKDEKEK